MRLHGEIRWDVVNGQWIERAWGSPDGRTLTAEEASAAALRLTSGACVRCTHPAEPECMLCVNCGCDAQRRLNDGVDGLWRELHRLGAVWHDGVGISALTADLVLRDGRRELARVAPEAAIATMRTLPDGAGMSGVMSAFLA